MVPFLSGQFFLHLAAELFFREKASVAQLAEVRHGMIVKPPKSSRISLGGREVCTTF